MSKTTPSRTAKKAQAKAVPFEQWLASRIQKDPDEALEHLNAMLEAPDEPELFLSALGDIAKIGGMTRLAEEAGLNREALYVMLSEKGNPTFSSLMKVLDAIGLQFMVTRKG